FQAIRQSEGHFKSLPRERRSGWRNRLRNREMYGRCLGDRSLARGWNDNRAVRSEAGRHRVGRAEQMTRKGRMGPWTKVKPQPFPGLDGVIVLEDADFQRLAVSKRGEWMAFVPLETPKGLRRDASVYVEGHSKKTVTSGGREYRLVAAVRELEPLSETNQEPKNAPVTLEWMIYFLTEEDWKNRPRGPFIID